jgi:hypothetical protein
MLAEHNLAPGNTGYIFWYDPLAPSFLITLYVATGYPGAVNGGSARRQSRPRRCGSARTTE